jgi:hypothetical protein
MSSIELTSAPTRADSVAVHPDGSLAEVLVADSGDAYRLNDTAYALWELCDGTTTVREMVDAVSTLFDAPADQLERDVTGALQHLLDAGLIDLPAAERHAP